MIDRRGFIGAIAGAIAFGKMPAVAERSVMSLRDLKKYIVLGKNWSDIDNGIGMHCQLHCWESPNCKHSTTLAVRMTESIDEEGNAGIWFDRMSLCRNSDDSIGKMYDMVYKTLRENGLSYPCGLHWDNGIPIRFVTPEHPMYLGGFFGDWR